MLADPGVYDCVQPVFRARPRPAGSAVGAGVTLITTAPTHVAGTCPPGPARASARVADIVVWVYVGYNQDRPGAANQATMAAESLLLALTRSVRLA
jgi:hypothetical protein